MRWDQAAVDLARRFARWWVAHRGPGCGALRLVETPSSTQSIQLLRFAVTLLGGNLFRLAAIEVGEADKYEHPQEERQRYSCV